MTSENDSIELYSVWNVADLYPSKIIYIWCNFKHLNTISKWNLKFHFSEWLSKNFSEWKLFLAFSFLKPINKFNAFKWKTLDSKKIPDIQCSTGLKKYCLILYKGFLWKILKNINNVYILSLFPTSLSLSIHIYLPLLASLSI